MSKIIINGEQSFVSDQGDIRTQLGTLSDVDLTGLTDNDILQFNQGSGLWERTPLNVATALGDLTDVDLTGLADGNIIAYNSTSGNWEVEVPATANVTISDTAPVSPLNGDLWWNSANGSLYIYFVDVDSSQWVELLGGGGGGGANVSSGDAPPSGPSANDLWFNTANGRTYIYYTDVDSSQWIEKR